jgi:hypothetical protein
VHFVSPRLSFVFFSFSIAFVIYLIGFVTCECLLPSFVLFGLAIVEFLPLVFLGHFSSFHFILSLSSKRCVVILSFFLGDFFPFHFILSFSPPTVPFRARRQRRGPDLSDGGAFVVVGHPRLICHVVCAIDRPCHGNCLLPGRTVLVVFF